MQEIEPDDRRANIIGIDLGTSKTCLARFNDLGIAQCTHNHEGEVFTPSVVLIENDGNVTCGREAKKCVGLNHDNVFSEFKRHIGTEASWKIGRGNVTATDLSAMLLKQVVADYSRQFGHPNKIAITWPGNFRQEQREATKTAALRAGLRDVCFVEEAIAAALYYAQEVSLNGFYLIYDLGGGTFDATLIKAIGVDITVINQAGVQQLGGKDFDDELLKLVREKFRSATGHEFDRIDCCFSELDVQNARHTLSVRPSVQIRLVSSIFGCVSVEVSREEFSDRISHLIAQAEMACLGALSVGEDEQRKANKASDVKEIFMVGDACRTPAIQESVSRLFGKKPVIRNPSQVVAMGAAIFAALKAKHKGMTSLQLHALEKIKAEPITPYYFGTTILDHENGCARNLIVIKKGEKLPCRITRTYFTTHEGQSTIRCDMTQSADDTSEPDFASTLFECALTLPKNTPRGIPVIVTFACDIDGCASLTICAPPEAGGGSTTATATFPPPSPPLQDEHRP
jgi:molecular chaperone DnaK